ncbi:hypothetical protein FK513_32770, partial [Klebsiella pneumoniae]|nr:hypothetical protein [Klebsiella pneumoniae]
DVVISDALTFMAGDRSHVEEAYPGDIIGLHNHGSMIKPGSDMISASGPISTTGFRSRINVFSLALCGAMLTTT